MSTDNKDNEFDFLPPAEPPPSFNQEKDQLSRTGSTPKISEWLKTLGFRWNTPMKIFSQKTRRPPLSTLVLLVLAVAETKWRMLFWSLASIRHLLVNSTGKDIPKNVEEDHVVLIPDSDGIGKNIDYGKEVFSTNGAIVEDALRIKLGKVDWLFVLSWRRWWNW